MRLKIEEEKWEPFHLCNLTLKNALVNTFSPKSSNEKPPPPPTFQKQKRMDLYPPPNSLKMKKKVLTHTYPLGIKINAIQSSKNQKKKTCTLKNRKIWTIHQPTLGSPPALPLPLPKKTCKYLSPPSNLFLKIKKKQPHNPKP
jgi:hypothetical protein